MWGLPRLDDGQRDLIGMSVLLWKAAIIICTALTSLFSLLAAIAAETDKCAGQFWLVGYRSGISDFLAIPLISAVGSVVFSVKMTNQRAWKVVLDAAESNVLGAPRGAFVLYWTLAIGLIVFGAPTVFSIVRYSKIADYCRSTTAVNTENSIAFPTIPSSSGAQLQFSH